MKATVSRSVADFIVILILASLLIPPVPPTTLRRDVVPSPDGPSVPRRADVQAVKESSAEEPGQPTEPAPTADPGTVTAPGHSTDATRRAGTTLAARAASVQTAPPHPSDAVNVVRIGPISESHAAEIVRQLEAAHYSPRTDEGQTEPERFRVVGGPMRRSDADALAAALVRKGFPSFVLALPDDQVEMQFGVFSTQGYARDLASRLQGQGYAPAVVRESPARILRVALPSSGSVTAIVKIIESTMAHRALRVVPCGSKEPLIRVWRGWVQVCKVSSNGLTYLMLG